MEYAEAIRLELTNRPFVRPLVNLLQHVFFEWVRSLRQGYCRILGLIRHQALTIRSRFASECWIFKHTDQPHRDACLRCMKPHTSALAKGMLIRIHSKLETGGSTTAIDITCDDSISKRTDTCLKEYAHNVERAYNLRTTLEIVDNSNWLKSHWV